MIKFAVESLAEILPEMEPLLREHWSEIAPVEDAPYDPNLELYQYFDSVGMLLIISARDDDKLVGYFACILRPHPHSQKIITAVEEAFYVIPDKRKHSIGQRLIKLMLVALQERKVHKLYTHEFVGHKIGPLYEKLKFKKLYTIYGRSVGEI